MQLFKPLYEFALRWAAHPRAEQFLVGLSFIEAFIFPVAPEIMLAPMTLAKPSAGRVTRRSACSARCSVHSSAMRSAIMRFDWCAHFSPTSAGCRAIESQVARLASLSAWKIFWLLVLAGFLPIPLKIFTWASGIVGVPFPAFIAGMLVGRGKRVYLLCGLIKLGGKQSGGRVAPLDRVDRLGLDCADRACWSCISNICVDRICQTMRAHHELTITERQQHGRWIADGVDRCWPCCAAHRIRQRRLRIVLQVRRRLGDAQRVPRHARIRAAIASYAATRCMRSPSSVVWIIAIWRHGTAIAPPYRIYVGSGIAFERAGHGGLGAEASADHVSPLSGRVRNADSWRINCTAGGECTAAGQTCGHGSGAGHQRCSRTCRRIRNGDASTGRIRLSRHPPPAPVAVQEKIAAPTSAPSNAAPAKPVAEAPSKPVAASVYGVGRRDLALAE